jgi:hypothetical protein
MNMGVDLESEMEISRRELRVLLLHEFCLDRTATEATSNMCDTMGEDVLSIHTAQHWFPRFKNGNFELDDSPHTVRILQVYMDFLKQLIEEDPRWTILRVLSRVTWVLAYYSGNTSPGMRQNVEIRSLDSTLCVIASASMQE